jgi:hypothetical protein
MTTAVYDDFTAKYLMLCANPLRDDTQVKSELEELKRNPRVKCLGFYSKDILMVGTDEIILIDKGTKHLIGEFILFLSRRYDRGYWKVAFRFWNVNGLMYLKDEEGRTKGEGRIHPHILQSESPMLTCPSGELCISQGQFGVYQYMRKGELHYATQRLIEILETYPTGRPYLEASHWPVWTGDKHV